jgi:hypothetical protein
MSKKEEKKPRKKICSTVSEVQDLIKKMKNDVVLVEDKVEVYFHFIQSDDNLLYTIE